MTTTQTTEPDAPFDPAAAERVEAFLPELLDIPAEPVATQLGAARFAADVREVLRQLAYRKTEGEQLADKCHRHREEAEELRAQLALHNTATPEVEAIHLFFGLSYASYLVLPRVLLQSMPDWWQTAFVRLVEQFYGAFQDVEKPEAYDVVPGRVEEVLSLTDAERELLGITFEDPDEDEDGEYVDPDATTKYYDKNGDELRYDSRVVVPMRDPLPPYNRGRTVIPPKFSAETDADDGAESVA